MAGPKSDWNLDLLYANAELSQQQEAGGYTGIPELLRCFLRGRHSMESFKEIYFLYFSLLFYPKILPSKGKVFLTPTWDLARMHFLSKYLQGTKQKAFQNSGVGLRNVSEILENEAPANQEIDSPRQVLVV